MAFVSPVYNVIAVPIEKIIPNTYNPNSVAPPEMKLLYESIKQDGYTLVPLSVYFKDARVKVEVGLCKGKKNYDKRESTAKRDAKREIDRTMKERNR